MSAATPSSPSPSVLADAGSIRELADRYVGEVCARDPLRATFLGVPGQEDRLTDFSPDGTEARAGLDREALVALARLEPADDDERRSAAFMAERLGSALALVDAGEHLRSLRNLGSPAQVLRQVFDVMPRRTVEDWEHVAARLAAMPEAVGRYRAALAAGADAGLVAARRQALVVAEQCRVWAGTAPGAPASFFAGLAARAEARSEPLAAALVARLHEAAALAAGAYDDLARYLAGTYAAQAAEVDAVGAERYVELARASLGMDVDPVETYAWGWEELARIEAEMAALAGVVAPGASAIGEAVAHLETASPLVVEGEDHLRAWLQDLMDRAVDELDGRHFDIPGPVRRVEAMIAPPGGAAAMYYTGPSEDFSRPGRTWYPTLGRTRFPLWGEVSIAYHEGVPGHHLQVAQVLYRRERLSRFQRSGFVSGHAEGWALYAERLMDELGFLEEPAYRFGRLRNEVMRAVRIIVDIGMHLGLEIPAGQPFHPGERWDPALGLAFLEAHVPFPADFLRSEVVRYLGWPGQAISYKVGERVWRAGRAAAQRRHGGAFDLKAFHRFALDLGPLGLDLLEDELARF
jgi:uncharacterized protein (DUF885 family)